LTDQNADSNNLHVRIIRKKVQSGTKPTAHMEKCLRYFVSRCRERGVRVTTQRLAVFQALARNPTHPTADSLHEALKETMPSLSLSTVYRILESLENEGLIRRVSTTNGTARYDANLATHQHLVCRLCGRMTDLNNKSFAQPGLPGVRFAGFVAEELDIRIVGTCLECRSSKSRQMEFNK
jgi:Fur family transcriptional regulator, peroxide stress response regulator